MQTAGSRADSPSITIFATLLLTASGHPGNLGWDVITNRIGEIENKLAAALDDKDD